MNEPVAISPERSRAAQALLRWYAEAGIDIMLQEHPRDRFAETRAEAAERAARADGPAHAGRPAAAPAAPAIGRDRSQSAAPPTPPAAAYGASQSDAAHPSSGYPALGGGMAEDEAMLDARARSAKAASLAELREALADFEGCSLRQTARALVFGNGAEDADLMVVGEAPGREEDAAGEPFVGRSGRLLDLMLQSIGLERTAVRVTNTVPWRPPGNRASTPSETQVCLPFLRRQIELVRPKVLLCLGSPAAKAVLDSPEGIMRLRGRWSDLPFDDGQLTIAVTASLHPAYLLRQPSQKRLAWRDLLAIRQRLRE